MNDLAREQIKVLREHGYAAEQINAGVLAKHQVELRDTFAAAALQGIFAKPTAHGTFAVYAEDAYNAADAMLIERGKRQ